MMSIESLNKQKLSYLIKMTIERTESDIRQHLKTLNTEDLKCLKIKKENINTDDIIEIVEKIYLTNEESDKQAIQVNQLIKQTKLEEIPILLESNELNKYFSQAIAVNNALKNTAVFETINRFKLLNLRKNGKAQHISERQWGKFIDNEINEELNKMKSNAKKHTHRQ